MEDMNKMMQKSHKNHNITINDREDIKITGILDVLSFDEELVICQSDIGVLILKGTNLHINKLDLDNGILDIVGYITSINYEENHQLSKNHQSFFSKVFK